MLSMYVVPTAIQVGDSPNYVFAPEHENTAHHACVFGSECTARAATASITFAV